MIIYNGIQLYPYQMAMAFCVCHVAYMCIYDVLACNTDSKHCGAHSRKLSQDVVDKPGQYQWDQELTAPVGQPHHKLEDDSTKLQGLSSK